MSNPTNGTKSGEGVKMNGKDLVHKLRDILQNLILKVGFKKFEEPPLEKEILAFLASLGHSGEIRKITDVNVNKLHQPWRSFAAIINKCLSGKPSYDSLCLSQAQILWGMYNNKKLVVNFVMAKDPSIPRRNKVNWHYARDDPMFTTINVISRNEDTQLYGTILPVALTNEDIRNSESYKEYYAIASGKIPPKTKASKKKADSDATTKQKPPTVPKEKKGKKTGKGKQKAKELETISEAVLTEAEQLKIITKRSRKETHSSHASGSGADEGTGVSPGVPDAPDYDSDDDISWKSSEDDQDDDKNDDDENAQDDEDDDKNDDDENAQDDDDEAQTESEDDGDDFIHPKLTTHDDETTHEEETDEDDTFDPIVHTPSYVSSSDDEDSDNEVEGMDVEGEKSDEDATYVEDQGNEADRDTNANLEGRDDVKTDVVLPQVQATQEIKDTHVTLTPVNPDGQQQSSSVSSGFVSNMLNPNQDTGVDAIFGHNAQATSLIDIPVTAIAEPSFFAPTNRPPTPTPLFIQLQQPPILTPATTPSSSLQNLPDFGSLFGFDNRLKALEDNFSEFKQTNQYAEALSSIPGIVDQYLANKMKEAVDVAVQLKSDRIREEAQAENQQFLDSIDEGMKKVIKEQVKSEVSKITPKIEKLVNEQLESEVLVRSSKEAKTSHVVAANLSELELKKILIDKMEANKSISRESEWILPQTLEPTRHSKCKSYDSGIDKRLKTKEDHVGLGERCYGRPFNTTAGNPVKKILLKLNLSDHRLFKDGGGGLSAKVVVSRKNRTLIDARRTMLVDSKLPTTFWAEAVNTACYVLNRDHLGKFDGKAGEGYFDGYSVVSKAMRVFNKRTRIVEETLNIRFLENTLNMKGNGPDWLFDVDSLSNSMNYNEAYQKWMKRKLSDKSGSMTRSRELCQKVKSNRKADSNTLTVNTAGPFVSTANKSEEQLFKRFSPFKNAFTLPPVPNISSMDNTGIFGNAYDDEDVEEEVDMNNVISSYTVPDTSFTKFHKDHPEDQVIGSLKTPVQTRHMTKINEEHVDLPRDKWAIGTKWVFRNKKDEKGIMVKNKARLVAHGHTQEEGIGYDEVFAPVARIEP
ncbi:uncharacterized mitochondrial protein-like protein [Tanacetum coccineum]